MKNSIAQHWKSCASIVFGGLQYIAAKSVSHDEKLENQFVMPLILVMQ